MLIENREERRMQEEVWIKTANERGSGRGERLKGMARTVL